MKNTDIFNIISFEIFYRCLDEFPSPAYFSIEDVANQVHSYCSGLSSPPDKKRIESKVSNTTIWLKQEGYLVDRGSGDTGFSVVLSERGLHALNLKPSSLSSNESFGDRISQGISNISEGTLSGLMVEFFNSLR